MSLCHRYANFSSFLMIFSHFLNDYNQIRWIKTDLVKRRVQDEKCYTNITTEIMLMLFKMITAKTLSRCYDTSIDTK